MIKIQIKDTVFFCDTPEEAVSIMGFSFPCEQKRRRSAKKYPWGKIKKMVVGDSFTLKEGNGTKIVGNANYRYKPMHFLWDKAGDGIRVWRDK